MDLHITDEAVAALRAAKKAGGKSAMPEYFTWARMLQRCHNPRLPEYSYYGGRGIAVWEPWRVSFELFFLCMGPMAPPANEIDRINNDGNYEPGNCRWATRTEQTRNTRRNRHFTAFGRTMLLSDWGRESGLSIRTIRGRIKLGWDVERAVSEPPDLSRRARFVEYDREHG
jgi:hypothetical protein